MNEGLVVHGANSIQARITSAKAPGCTITMDLLEKYLPASLGEGCLLGTGNNGSHCALRTKWRWFACILTPLVASSSCAELLGEFDKASVSETDVTDAGEEPPACPQGLTFCRGFCVDTRHAPDHCGRCEHSCRGGLCDESACIEIEVADTDKDPLQLAIDAKDVYWRTATAVWRHSKDEKVNGYSQVAAPAAALVHRIAVSGSRIFWSESTGGDPHSETNPCGLCKVLAKDKGNLQGVPQVLFAVGDNEQLQQFAVDDEFVYVAVLDQGWNSRIGKIPASGGTEVTLVSDAMNVHHLAAFGGRVYWVTDGYLMANGTSVPDVPEKIAKLAGYQVSQLAFTSDTVLWAGQDYDVCHVWSARLDGTQGEGGNKPFWKSPECPGSARPHHVVVADNDVYWWSHDPTSIRKAALSDGLDATLHVPPKPIDGTLGLAADDQFVYWLQDQGQRVMKVAR